MSLKYLLVLAAVLAAGVAVSWLRSRRDAAGNATPARHQLVQLAWSLALALLTVSALATVYWPFWRTGYTSWLLVAAVAVALVLAARPALARRLVPPGLIALGLAGLPVAFEYAAPGYSSAVVGPAGGIDSYGVVMVGSQGPAADLILPQAWLFLLLGLWLAWRSAGPWLARSGHAPGRLGAVPPRAAWRALALLPVVILAAEMSEWVRNEAAVAAGVVLAAAAVVICRWPAVAARIAALGLVALAVAGLAVALHWQWPDMPADVGLVVVDGPRAAYAGLAQALILLAAGAWLVPQSFPAARRLIGLPPDPALARRVQQLTRSREAAVDNAASQLRRLERDLHDGAQVRLVALGMNLRAAERLIPENPAAAVALVAEAREASARALTELRELVRGVHPPVLADRGLADAVRALALDSPLRVQADIDLPGRLPAPVETACYFAVAELLANAAKHSGARDAQVAMSHAGGRLRITVTDFGLGGADPKAGTGLAGVERRLAAFDGLLAVSSPPGGPTIVVLEVPCALAPATRPAATL